MATLRKLKDFFVGRKLKAFFAFLFLALFGFYTYKVAFWAHKAGKVEVRQEWAAVEIKRQAAMEKDRANRQAMTDAADAENARLQAELQAEKDKRNEDLDNAIQNDNSPCDRLSDDVVRAHNAKISAGTR